MFHRFHDLKAGHDAEMMSGSRSSSNSSSSAPPSEQHTEGRMIFPPTLREDPNTSASPTGVPHQYPNTSSPAPGYVGQPPPVMSLGHNVMLSSGKLVPGVTSEAHRYMSETYRLATGDSPVSRLAYTAGGGGRLQAEPQSLVGRLHSEPQSLVGRLQAEPQSLVGRLQSEPQSLVGRLQAEPQSLVAELHRAALDSMTSPLLGDNRTSLPRQSSSEKLPYNPVNLVPHMGMDAPRVDSTSGRLLQTPDRLPQSNRLVTTKETESVNYSKIGYSGSISESSQGPPQMGKSKSSSLLPAPPMFPVSFSPSYQQFPEEGSSSYKRHYFTESPEARRDPMVDHASSEGELPHSSRGRSDVGAVAQPEMGFGESCISENVYNDQEATNNLARLNKSNEHSNLEPMPKIKSDEQSNLESMPRIKTNDNDNLNPMPQALPSLSEVLPRSTLPKGRQPREYKCQMCDLEFKNSTQLKNHTWRHTGEKPYACNICHATFTQQSNLKTHMRIHTGERPYACDECNSTFTQISNLRTHQKTHTGEKPYECDICFTRFSQQSNLKSHKLIHSGERPFHCEECGASFIQSTHLRNHRRIHTDERPYSCEQCGSKFRQLSNLKTHEKTHTGERPHICDECGSSFAQKSNLKSHKMKLHANDGTPSRRGRKKKLEAIRPYICEECGAKFTMMSNLKIHMRLHTGEKPYTCCTCGVSFAQKSNLKAHETTHSDERPHKCSECSSSFRQKTNLKTHKMKKHPVKSLKIRILQDSQYIMQDLEQVGEESAMSGAGTTTFQSIEEPIVQIREGKTAQLGLLNSPGLMATTGIKYEVGDLYSQSDDHAAVDKTVVGDLHSQSDGHTSADKTVVGHLYSQSDGHASVEKTVVGDLYTHSDNHTSVDKTVAAGESTDAYPAELNPYSPTF